MVMPVLMSIRPRYADAILDGAKTVELRRRRPSFSAGSTVYVYATSPSQRIQGVFEVGGVIEAPPARLWSQVKDRAGIDRSTFNQYFDGCDRAYAIEILNPRRILPSRLAMRPPQSYQFLDASRRRHRAVLGLATA